MSPHYGANVFLFLKLEPEKMEMEKGTREMQSYHSAANFGSGRGLWISVDKFVYYIHIFAQFFFTFSHFNQYNMHSWTAVQFVTIN